MSAAVHILILAAGSSTRMQGADKLLLTIDGEPLLRRVASRAVATGAPVMVALSPRFPDRFAALQGLSLRLARVPDAEQGMSRSLVRGLAAIRATHPAAGTGVMILPADMPGFTTDALRGMIAAFAAAPNRILRGQSRQQLGPQAGHPAIFPAAQWCELDELTGDEGGRSVIARHADTVTLYPLPGDMAVRDLDTPADWQALASKR
jgi:molybdenum cofactor cytidylyltransferase